METMTLFGNMENRAKNARKEIIFLTKVSHKKNFVECTNAKEEIRYPYKIE